MQSLRITAAGARHPYLVGDVPAVRIDASELGLVPLALRREGAVQDAGGRDAAGDGRPVYRLAQVAPASNDSGEDAAAALRRLLRLDPAGRLGAGARLAAIEAGKTWRELEVTP